MQQSRHIGKLVISMQEDKPASLPIVRTQSTVQPGATYLVTGGLGGFGLATARWLVDQGATSLALIGRRGPVTEEAIAGIAEMEKAGATVRSFAADVADANLLSNVLSDVRATMPPLRGIIHAAAVIEDAPIIQIDSDQLNRVLSPKTLGAWNLHQATLHDPIDMFVLYSSSSTVVGNPGQGAYVAGNLYLDSLAQCRRSLGLPGLAIGWGAIKDTGFLTRHTSVADMLRARTGLDATQSQEALADFGRLSAVGSTRVCVARFDLQRLGQMLPGVLVPRFFPIITQNAAAVLHAEETLAQRLLKTPEADRRDMVLACIREHAARILGTGTQQIDVNQPLADLGLDSLMAVELAVAVERDLAQPVSVMQLLSAGTIAAISAFAIKVLGVSQKDDSILQRSSEKSDVLQEVTS
jgi:NAD(P)-dependent dehydrogenase (short-subunit alcohol dehydrogenase family)/acyl carrier protein